MKYQETTKQAVRTYVKDETSVQADLAKKIGISPQSLSNKLNGKTEFTVSELVKLSQLIGVDINDLVAD